MHREKSNLRKQNRKDHYSCGAGGRRTNLSCPSRSLQKARPVQRGNFQVAIPGCKGLGICLRLLGNTLSSLQPKAGRGVGRGGPLFVALESKDATKAKNGKREDFPCNFPKQCLLWTTEWGAFEASGCMSDQDRACKVGGTQGRSYRKVAGSRSYLAAGTHKGQRGPGLSILWLRLVCCLGSS